MLYFFMSYASDEDVIFVRRLHRDLSVEIIRRIGSEPQQAVGYLDDSSGAKWPVDARNALSSCQTFIPLCSLRYLMDERCGRRWGVFAERVRARQAEMSQSEDRLMPVQWARDDLPDDLFTEPDLDVRPHRAPNGEDLRVLIRLQSHRPAYRAFVTSLAHRVVASAHAYRLPPAQLGIDLDAVPNVFESRLAALGRADLPAKVVVVVAAGTREQMRAVRTDLQFYGVRREDWAPFQPQAVQSVASRAREIASDRRLRSEVVSLESVPERLRTGPRQDILVLLVDAWAITWLDHLRSALREIGSRDDATTVVLIPASRDDPETANHRNELRRAVLAAFPGRSVRRDHLFHPEVDSADDFDADLSVAIAVAQRQVSRPTRPEGRSADRHAVGRPVLEGP
uniref:FxsC protein n=1 Tax=Paractinoplanes polyasparticus TaxID=2856853 RepID=UPI001C85BC74|nr:FxsC protein [Actinoplanes polyasparticus]